MNSKIAIILPMYNEEKNVPLIIGQIFQTAKDTNLNIQIIAVNDGSIDKTGQLLVKLSKKQPNLITVTHPVNKGMAQAIRTGINKAKEKKFDILIFMDSDLTHNPKDLPRFVQKIEEGCDYVIGSRYIKNGGMIDVPFKRILISKLGNLFGRLFLHIHLSDLTSGFRGGRMEVFKQISLKENGFNIQLEGTVKIIGKNFKVGEIPIILSSRIHGKSKMKYDFEFYKSYFLLLLKCRKFLKNIT